MATMPRYPSLFQINTRVWLQRLSREAGKPITLADIDDATIDSFAERGFDWIWLLSVWQIGSAGRAVSRGNPQWRSEFQAVLPDLTEDDICGSGFAITAYSVSEALGGESALAQFRGRLARRGIKLMLDFVPNHTAPDHPWVKTHPDYYIEGSEAALAAAPGNYLRVDTDWGSKILAYGRDPNFPGWPDTLQLNYGNPELQRARIDELIAIAGKCDGVRCDMAMLLLPEIFQRTWGLTPEPFWPKAIPAVRARYPAFTFMAEVYWDLEWELQQQGFAYCYDKRLYDRLRDGHATPIRGHLLAGLDYQDKLSRFLENHDEPRAAAEFPWPQHQAAAIITFLSPGLRFFYEGQFEGARVRVPPHLGRGPVEPIDQEAAAFYAKLLSVLKGTGAFRDGAWSQIQASPAWSDNWTSDGFVAYAWAGEDGSRHLVVVNYAGNQGQCRLPLPFPELRGKHVRLADLMGAEIYDRDGTELVDRGLYIDHAPWHFNVFVLRAI
ncbi:MAG TPA: alpha-amylase family glycosyl hydrolase [Stellaceae bacterium]|nr:alpha-amylase family glycosyl hydrolase [Stellaceae bacterium]